ncbi:sporulation protein YqfD [Clostridium bovifaecis]|uniref:Sporulation protein YqfD n=1 Tax=Clostridium bovifaecis TaxID=2184719 RepID=A0A6I6ET95_9CLOT|nr:sporulation protein YqfD [Clostridium bovifaecis]
MSKFNFEKYRRGIITVEIQTMTPEKFINLLWKSDVSLGNVKRKNITTMCFNTNLKYYDKISDIAKRTDTKIKIVSRRGLSFFIIKNRKRKTLLGGMIIFGLIIYYLSTFIWNINIITENNVTPYEIRSQLKALGIGPGISKSKIDVYDLEEKVIKNNSDIMWVRARIEGAKLNISIAERQEPPGFIIDNSPCNVVAKKDGEIIRLYSAAGTAIVKGGDVVKKGDVLVKGEQGKEGGTYQVHAEAEVIARTFYEEKIQVPIRYVSRERTGKKDENLYVEILGKKLYLKKAKNNFKVYDKMFIDRSFIKKETYFEVEEKLKKRDKKEVEEKNANELFSNIIVKLDKSVKIIDKIVDSTQKDDKFEIRVVLVVEENIAETQLIQPSTDENIEKSKM